MGWRGYKFPEDPPEINPEALYDDPLALVEFREWKTRRKFIEIEKAKVYISISISQSFQKFELARIYSSFKWHAVSYVVTSFRFFWNPS